MRTELLWEAGLDAIVISVGSTLGHLGYAVSLQFPDADWPSVPDGEVTPERPLLLALRDDSPIPLRFAVVVTPHDGHEYNDATVRAIGVAAGAAIRAAANEGVVALGLPLLGTGNQGVPVIRRFSCVLPSAVCSKAVVAVSFFVPAAR
ncbi:hypothetical protein [Amycolatopsis sp. FDAARGOS 1241]|uniref:hypothetical protein n=1 Tax=Amycolatopsis sp. FDAARGOS 1241 TaxID=2778070 RepID=UPI001EF1F4F9|nr:hypothetical protein [Amycolatopsis sp. FDAARGOS 1241]